MEFDFEQLVLAQRLRATLFVSFELILELLDFDSQVINYAPVVVGAATLRLCWLEVRQDGESLVGDPILGR